MHVAGHADQRRQELSTYTNTNSTDDCILSPSPANQNDSPSRQLYTYIYRTDVYASDAQSAQALALDPQLSQLLAPRYTKPLQVSSPAPSANESSSLNDLLINSLRQ